jgi:hypothetical protein
MLDWRVRPPLLRRATTVTRWRAGRSEGEAERQGYGRHPKAPRPKHPGEWPPGPKMLCGRCRKPVGSQTRSELVPRQLTGLPEDKGSLKAPAQFRSPQRSPEQLGHMPATKDVPETSRRLRARRLEQQSPSPFWKPVSSPKQLDSRHSDGAARPAEASRSRPHSCQAVVRWRARSARPSPTSRAGDRPDGSSRSRASRSGESPHSAR